MGFTLRRIFDHKLEDEASLLLTITIRTSNGLKNIINMDLDTLKLDKPAGLDED